MQLNLDPGPSGANVAIGTKFLKENIPLEEMVFKTKKAETNFWYFGLKIVSQVIFVQSVTKYKLNPSKQYQNKTSVSTLQNCMCCTWADIWTHQMYYRGKHESYERYTEDRWDE